MNKPTQQQIVEAYKKLPPPVREFLADPDQLARVLTDIKNTHNLHIDVIGRVSEFIGYFLLGLASPSEFKDALKAADVPESTTNDIIGEINQKIFVPLREQMRKGPEAKQEPAKPVMTVPQPQPQGAAAQPPRPNWGSNKPPTEVKPPQVESGRPGLRNLLASITAEVPKSIESRKLLEDHEEPHIEFNKPSTIPSIVVPLPPPPAPQRIAPPKPVVSDKVQGASSPIPLKSSTLPLTPSPAKPYSTDPYREPIDEK